MDVSQSPVPGKICAHVSLWGANRGWQGFLALLKVLRSLIRALRSISDFGGSRLWFYPSCRNPMVPLKMWYRFPGDASIRSMQADGKWASDDKRNG